MNKFNNFEHAGIEVVSNDFSSKGKTLFWPWMAANVSFLAISYGSFVLNFKISFWQIVLATIFGTIFSFLIVGISSLAGKKSNAPTMTLSRATFGINGNKLPGILTYLLLVGWETVLVALATLACRTIFERIGNLSPNIASVVGFTVAALLTITSAVIGYQIILKVQKWLTIFSLILTVGYVALTFQQIDFSKIGSFPNGNLSGFIGVLIFTFTGIGLGWVNCAADYSRYISKSVSNKSVISWTVFSASIVPIFMVIYGSLLAMSDSKLSEQIAIDPIGALTSILPTWYLIPFAVVAVLGLVGGAILDLYSSGITMVSLGVPLKRYQAAFIDGLIMTFGTIYFVWFADDFFLPFQGFLITLGVPIAAWSGIFVADILLRKKDYAEKDLFDAKGRYKSINWSSITILLVGTFIGYGFVTNTFATWLNWQGYFLNMVGGKSGTWAAANIGVINALALGFFGRFIFGRKEVKWQESF